MMSEAPKQLNAFEIKSEISRLVKALEKSTILIDTSEFKTLDEQNDPQNIVKILLKEFYLCNDETMPVIKLLLLRYADEDYLLQEMETIIKNPKHENNLKLHAIELISSFKADWHGENYDSYLEYNEELVRQETQELLESSKDNPEIQLDFLDFFSAIPPKDQMMLLESLEDDQQGEDLANILVPIFLSFPKTDIGLTALKMLSGTKSPFAYESLVQVSDSLDETSRQNIKKCVSELKLSGAGKKFELSADAHKDAKFYIIPPDGEGNFSLIYEKPNYDDKTVQLVGMVIDDYTGVRECLGFSAISEFEASFLLDKLTGTDFKTLIDAQMFKKLMLQGEKLNYRKSAPPYEYNCWKRIFLDIAPADIEIEELLKEKFSDKTVTKEDIRQVLDAEFTVPWFYTHNFGDETEHFFNELDKKLKENRIDEIDIDTFVAENINNVIYDDEKTNWKQRIFLTAYTKLDDEQTAGTLYKIAEDTDAMQVLYTFILRQSVFQYFLNMLTDNNFLKYKQQIVEDNLAYLEQLWGFYV
ncbi:MAG: hypothetical protein NC390_07050 [Fusobacterium sp.]|nr:hypothetical protein [Fusobacterium sp.]